MNPLNQTLVCPKCKQEISVDDALGSQLKDQLSKDLKDEYNKKWLEEKKKLSESTDVELKALKEENEKKDLELKKSREFELELRKKTRELEEKEKNLELEKQRQIDEEREKIRKETEKEILEKQYLKEKEKDQIIDSLKKSLDEAQRKASQGSQQAQGEVLELELENILKSEFPVDEIVPVGKGVSGADIIQKVFDKSGRHVGVIVWESKRTKAWDKSWPEKLKTDLLNVKGDVAVLVSMVLPEEIKSFGFKDGIYVTSFESFLPVAFLLRKSILDHHLVKQSVVGKNEKMEMVYNYFLSPEFQQRVSTIAEAFTAMKADLDTEKRVFAKLWAKREKEIEKVLLNTSSLHGELHGLIGESIPKVTALETEALLLEAEEN